ncbi:MAG: endonuclease/exonuclease/phosphatase family protein, partial [Bryobacteraceae bacterium]
ELGMHLALGDVRPLNGDVNGNAVLSKFSLHAVCKFDLTIPGREERGCLRTDVHLPDNHVVHLFNVHLGTSFFERRRQAEKLLDSELIRCGYPRVVIGDFNEWSHGLVSRSRARSLRAPTYACISTESVRIPACFLFSTSIIFIMTKDSTERVALHKTRTSLIASDHLPLFADFQLSDKLKSDARSSRHSK